MNTYAKFGALAIVIIGVLLWLAMGGISESKTYYKTIAELGQMGDHAPGKRLRVGGNVQTGSIVRLGAEVTFVLHQEAKMLRVVYNGIDPLPDTFKDGAQALADGKLGSDGIFQANKIQAKCASKYEVKPQLKKGAKAVSLFEMCLGSRQPPVEDRRDRSGVPHSAGHMQERSSPEREAAPAGHAAIEFGETLISESGINVNLFL